MNEKKKVENSIHGCCIGALAKFVAVLCALAFVLLVTSMISPPASHAAFPGANGKIAFESYRDGKVQIYTMNADGTDQTNLTNNSANNWLPKWSPDGAKIAFHSDRDGDLEVYVMNADGSGVTNLSNNVAADKWPNWSPDGTKIIFGSDRDGNNNLYVMNVDGTDVIQLTSDATNYQSSYIYPTWSPDGTKIGFTSDRDHDGTWDIYVMNTDGTNVIQLTHNSVNDYGPAWSPDSTKLAFGSGTGQSHDVYVMNPDGSGVTNLTNSPADDQLPAWSPDGTKIAFASNRSGNYGICVMNADGSGVTCLTNNIDATMDWQPLVPTPPDADGDGYTSDVDCNDNDPAINPGASDDNCNGVDENCSGTPDEGYIPTVTSCGVGACASTGQLICENGSTKDTCTPGAPTTEICDNIDNNCDGSVDENYVFGGFQQPINSDGSSIFKAGSTIPVKIILRDCSGQSISTATVTIGVYKIANAILGTEEELLVGSSGSANTGNLFRYDATAGQYIYNLSTKSYTKGSYRVYAKPDIGINYSVNFSLK